MGFITWFCSKLGCRIRRRGKVRQSILTNLPDQIIVVIFNHLPLSSQVSLSRVSKHLHSLAIKNVFPSRTSLTLILSVAQCDQLRLVRSSGFTIPYAGELRANPGHPEDTTKLFENYQGLDGEDVYSRLVSRVKPTAEATAWLTRSFPAINELKLVLDGHPPGTILDLVIALLDSYSVRLSTLKMWTLFPHEAEGTEKPKSGHCSLCVVC